MSVKNVKLCYRKKLLKKGGFSYFIYERGGDVDNRNRIRDGPTASCSRLAHIRSQKQQCLQKPSVPGGTA